MYIYIFFLLFFVCNKRKRLVGYMINLHTKVKMNTVDEI